MSVAVLSGAAGAQSTGTLGFEGIMTTTRGIPQGYGGFTWSGTEGLASWVIATPNTPGAPYLPHSGAANAWSNGADNLEFSAPSPFNFFSAWLGLGNGCPDGTNADVVVQSFRGIDNVDTRTVSLPCQSSALQQVDFNFSNITRVAIWHPNGPIANIILDDLDVAVSPVTTPEPATLVLLAPGVLALVPAMRRRISSPKS